MSTIERKSGIAMWRQIADEIRRAIAGGEFAVAQPLPGEMALAGRFGVNRHTVRSAIASLVQEGVLRAEQGRGTFVEKRERLLFPIRRRTRFSEGLADQTFTREGRLLSTAVERPEPETAAALAIAPDEEVVRLDMLYLADRMPISLARNYLPADRFAAIAAHVRQTRSITAALAACGVDDYTRSTTTITARHADGDDLKTLRLSPGAIVLLSRALNVDAQGRPIQYAITRFAADRIELGVETDSRPMA